MAQTSKASQPEKLWTRPFVLLCTGGFLSYASQQPLNPIIALWVVHLGGSATTIGLVTAAFSAPSFLFRPFIGRLCDTWSARGVFALGCLISGLGSLLILVPSLTFVFISQLLNGLGWAGLNTGAFTMTADIAPPSRRGAAVTYVAMARNSLGFYLPFLALKLKALYGFWLPFFGTAIAGILAALTVIGIPEKVKAPAVPKDTTIAAPTGFLDTFFDRATLLPSSLVLLASMNIPATMTFIILYAKHMGISESTIAQLFLLRGVIGIACQYLLAGLSDRIGRGKAIAIGLLTTAISMLVMSVATGAVLLMLGMTISATGGALTSPATQALAIDRSQSARRGTAMATYSLSVQLGSFFGGLVGGVLIDQLGYSPFYAISAVPAVMGLILLMARWKTIRAPGLSPQLSSS